ncbi:MAG: ABC transporter permease [Firmicutes bacterium]|nr:ABC transporter permease [Bacillota bacterium]
MAIVERDLTKNLPLSKTAAPSKSSSQRQSLGGFGVKLAFAVILATLLAAVFAPILAVSDPYRQSLVARLKAPIFVGGSGPHILGTDALGRDIASRLIYGARLSLYVSVTGALGACLIGTTLGLVAGRYGGWVERILLGIINMQLSIPFILLAITLVAVTKPGVTNIVFILIATGWAGYARVIRAETLKLNEAGFVESAEAIGQKEHLILWKHYLPNLLPQIIVLASMDIAKFIVLESSLSFLGLGVEPSIPTWGSMAAEGREYLATHWWLTTLPGLAVFSVCLALNTIGDWLRERLDPRSTVRG